MKGYRIKISKDELEKLYLEQMKSIQDIAEHYGVSYSTIRRRLEDYKIPIRTVQEARLAGRQLPTRGELVKLLQLGLSNQIIGEIYNVSREVIRLLRKKYNISKEEVMRPILELLKYLEPIPEVKYEVKKREDISVSLPIKTLLSDEVKDVTLTLVISDIHLGDANHLPATFWSTVGTLVTILEYLKSRFNIVRFRIVLNGDIVTGKGVFEGQEYQLLLPRGHWQVFLAEYVIGKLLRTIEEYVKVDEIMNIKGTHEVASENYMLYLKKGLISLGYKVKYGSRSTVINIAEPIGYYNILFTHGTGSSDYYPVAFAQIRDVWKSVNQYKLRKIPIERACIGHTHWLCTDLIAETMALDVTGGFQRWELKRTQRPSGFILYLFVDDEVSVIPVRPEYTVEIEEKLDPKLEYKNIKYYGEMLIKHFNEVEVA